MVTADVVQWIVTPLTRDKGPNLVENIGQNLFIDQQALTCDVTCPRTDSPPATVLIQGCDGM